MFLGFFLGMQISKRNWGIAIAHGKEFAVIKSSTYDISLYFPQSRHDSVMD